MHNAVVCSVKGFVAAAMICVAVGLPSVASAEGVSGVHMHGAHSCAFQHSIVRAAYHPDMSLPRGCAGGASRIGAGYTRLLSTSAVRHPKHMIRA